MGYVFNSKSSKRKKLPRGLMSTITLWWHQIIKNSEPRSIEYAVKSLDSLQGLYDGIVIGIDDGKSSDELYEVLSYYPNTFLFRLHFIDFAQAMQETLDRVPPCDYVGRSDGDEVLVNNPYEVRKWLAQTRPDAVNCATHYLYTIGWCKAGQTYRNESVRMWKYGTRRWGNPVHQYPYPISGPDNQFMADITFNHIKEADSLSMTDLNIRLMQKAIDDGDREYLWYIAKEYKIRGEVDRAINLCVEYLKGEVQSEITFNRALWGLSELCKQQGDYKGLLKRLYEIASVVKNNSELKKYIETTKNKIIN